MGDDQYRAIVGRRQRVGRQGDSGRFIKTLCRFVKEHHRSVREQDPSKRDSAKLTAGDFGAALANPGVERKWQRGEPRTKPDFVEDRAKFRVVSGGIADKQVGSNRGVEQVRLLLAATDDGPDVGRAQGLDVDAVDADNSSLEVEESPSIFFAGMVGSRVPCVVAHGEGRAEFAGSADASRASACVRFVDNEGDATERFPLNSNGSARGRAGFTTADGRVTILMPHPERVFRSVQMSWRPREWGEDSPWMRLFRNARAWVG